MLTWIGDAREGRTGVYVWADTGEWLKTVDINADVRVGVQEK